MTISARALLQRINRRLAPQCHRVCKTGNYPYADTLGDYHEVDEATNWIVRTHLDLTEVAQELGVLRGADVRS